MMARVHQVHQKDAMVDSELVFAFAKCEMLSDLEDFISSPN